jgi:hypothetical protein
MRALARVSIDLSNKHFNEKGFAGLTGPRLARTGWSAFARQRRLRGLRRAVASAALDA